MYKRQAKGDVCVHAPGGLWGSDFHVFTKGDPRNKNEQEWDKMRPPTTTELIWISPRLKMILDKRHPDEYLCSCVAKDTLVWIQAPTPTPEPSLDLFDDDALDRAFTHSETSSFSRVPELPDLEFLGGYVSDMDRLFLDEANDFDMDLEEANDYPMDFDIETTGETTYGSV